MGEGRFSVPEIGNTFCDTIHYLLRAQAKMGSCFYPEPEFSCHIIPRKAGGPPAQHAWLQDSRQKSMPEMCRFYVHAMGAM